MWCRLLRQLLRLLLLLLRLLLLRAGEPAGQLLLRWMQSRQSRLRRGQSA